MTGLLLTIVIINAAGREHLLKIGVLLILACLIHNLAGFLFGYWIARLVGLDERSCCTLSIEVGIQNGGLASEIALQMGKIATIGLAPAVFGPLMNITGSSLATWWRGRSIAPVSQQNSNSDCS
jgi:BASS family bile acid:Na+ symporter